MKNIGRLLLASLLGMLAFTENALAQAFSSPDATYLAGTLPGFSPGMPMGPAIAYQNQGGTDPIPDTLCVLGVCLVHGQGGFVVRCSFASRTALVVKTGTGPWFLAQL